MAVLVKTNTKASGVQTPTVNVLGASDTLTLGASETILANFYNPTAGSLTANLDGEGTTVLCPGLGDPIDVSNGYDVLVPAGATRFVVLSSIKEFLQGTTTITGGDLLELTLYKS